jgi:hypothetical protein
MSRLVLRTRLADTNPEKDTIFYLDFDVYFGHLTLSLLTRMWAQTIANG